MAEWEALSSPPLMGTPKLQLFTEQLFMRKTKSIHEKNQKRSTTKDIQKKPQ